MTPDKSADRAVELRKLPRADRLLAAADAAGLVARLGHEAVMACVRATLDEARRAVLDGGACPAAADVEGSLVARLRRGARGSLRPVVNATGVVLHTNLGRAPLSEEALAAMREVGRGYSNLEFDLEAGERGDRYGHAADALCRLTGAEAAVVVNNNAASVLLALAALCEAPPPRPSEDLTGLPPKQEGGAPEVVISRGQLVEIGGGFRIPDVLRRSGAALVEVGTTNRTYLRDYEAALTTRSRMLLSVHRSNFRMTGFTRDASLEDLVALARRRGLWVMDDLGSGTLLPTAAHGLAHEPTVQERVRTGADLVCFSGDKLLGGPQAGILVGRRDAIERVRRHPLMRALRVDKTTLAGLGATLAHYERGEAERAIPVWRAIGLRVEALDARARSWAAAIQDLLPGAEVRDGRSAVGGGSLPGVTLPSRLLALPCDAPDALAARLRGEDVPVVARVEGGAVVLDPRTVEPEEDDLVVRALRAALSARPLASP